MTFDLDSATADRQRTAVQAAADLAAPAAAVLDRDLTVPAVTLAALRAVLPADPAGSPLAWVVTVEALARASVALAIAAAAEALERPALTATPQWPGCRGVDLDGVVGSLGAHRSWAHAVTAALVGAAAAAVDHGVGVMKAGASRDVATVAVPEIADAAAAVDGARLLLWEAASRAGDGATDAALGMARMMALDAVRLAIGAAEQMVAPEALRPGGALERLRRDATTLAQVAGDSRGARAAVAAGTLPA